MNRLNRRVLPLVIVGTLSWGHWSKSATFNIANGDVGGLITAINTANTNNQNDDINLAANGTYILTNVNNMNDGPNGLPTITGDSGHQINIYGNGATITRSSSAPDFRIFFLLQSTESVALNDLVITNGVSMFSGGAIENAASLSLSRCVFSHNFAIAGNSNDELGGAIYNHGSSLAVDSCAFDDNHAVRAGGAIYSARGTLIVTDCTFTRNSTLDDGGPLYGGGAINIIGGSNPLIGYSTFSQNHGGSGGAVRVEAGASVVSMNNCTLTDNQAPASGTPSEGGAIKIDNTAGLTMTSCTVIGNQAQNGPDIWNSGVLTIGNSIVGYLSNSVGTVTSQGYNISQSPNSLLTGPADQTNTDAQLDPLGLQNNGGPTQTIALTHNSPAIDKGNAFGTTLDQRGVARPYDNPSIPNASGGDGSDIGAYEAPQDQVQSGSNFVVTTTDDHDDSLCSGADCTLREAVARANTVPGASSIGFAHTLSGTITLTMGELAVTDSLTITGIPIGTISGNNASRVFSFTGGSSYLYGLTIRDGHNQLLLGNITNGGGIYNSATLHVYGCSLINNRVQGTNALSPSSANGGAGQGGGIYNSGTLFLDTSAFIQANQASGGNGGPGNFGHGGVPSGSGGAGRGGAVFNDISGSLLITNCTFNGNVALGGNGGSGGPLGGNGGNGDGGAIYNLGALTIKSATINGNSGGGGAAGTGTTNGTPGTGSNGVTANGGTATVANTIIAGNVYVTGRNDDVDGAFTSSGYNLIGNGDFSTGFNATGDQVGTTAAPINPHLGPLQNNGGATLTMVPQPTSSALDRGFAFGLLSDQRGRSRPFDDPAIPDAPGGDGSDIGAVEISSGIAPTTVVSRKVHGVGTFDIPLNSDTLGDECRGGGASGDYSLIFTFAAPVTFTSASVCNGIGMVSNASASGNQITVNLTGITPADVLNVCLSNVNDGTTSGAVSVPFRVLVGDTTGNGSVNASDVSITKLKSGQTVDATNFREDVTVNNSINASDVSLVKSRSGTALP